MILQHARSTTQQSLCIGGPYAAVAEDDGFATVAVDGTQSHTHQPEATLSTFTWKEGSVVLGEGSIASLKLAVGSHDVTLKVTDSEGNESITGTVVNVLPNGFPDISQITPSKGKLEGGEKVVIYGKGFKTVNGIHFGDKYISKTDISITSDSEIMLVVPPNKFAVPVEVAVESAMGESNAELFTYEVNGVSISFSVEQLLATDNPTVVAFGPDSKLYIGSSDGVITKCTLDDTYTKILSKVTAEVAPGRFILGLTFDPTETVESNPNPSVYFTHSQMFHGEWRNSVGGAVNGKVSMATGAELDEVTDVVTGLPVSDHDHGVRCFECFFFLVGSINSSHPLSLQKNCRSTGLFSAILESCTFNWAETPMVRGKVFTD
jgi:IPT/TIG domain